MRENKKYCFPQVTCKEINKVHSILIDLPKIYHNLNIWIKIEYKKVEFMANIVRKRVTEFTDIRYKL